jgi:peptidoglycan/xylan/chitin deacetylase (PgdA/CDA1 family)
MTFRFDRFATLYIVNPLQWHNSETRPSIPILMYHSIADEDETAAHPYYRTATAPHVFAAQMDTLRQAGYSVITLAEAIRRLRTPESANRSVVITFDDGYRNFHSDAFPVMNQYGFTATMFLPTAYIANDHRIFNGKECLSWSEIRELQRYGIAFGSHTVNHPQLHDCAPHSIREELVGSKQIIEQALGCPVESFAYPYAFPEADDSFKARLRDTLSQAGYQNGVCTTIGRPDSVADLFFLKRLPINSCDDGRLFHAKLAGAYDWLAKPQYLAKMARKWVGAASHR